MGNAAAGEQKDYTTCAIDESGEAIDVGILSTPDVIDPVVAFRRSFSDVPLVFLSHRGPEAKEEIIRPTAWFLRNHLNVDVFFDDEDMKGGHSQSRSLVEPAYKCSHALILLSPNFRYSKYCVMELNTFLFRQRKGHVVLIPSLWLLSDVDELIGYSPALTDLNIIKPNTRDAPTFMVEKLWDELAIRLKRTAKEDYKQLLIKYIQEERSNDLTPAIPQTLEKWFHANALVSTAMASMTIGQVFEEGVLESESESVASKFSSCSSLSKESTRSSRNLTSSINLRPIRAFGRSKDDRSCLEDFADADSIWRYNWQCSPDGIKRDDANAFYYNAYVAYFKVQRVVAVDENARQVVVCTPMNWASYYIRKELRGEEDVTLNRAYNLGLSEATGDELDIAFKHMYYRRCIHESAIKYLSEEELLMITLINNRKTEKQWSIGGFPRNGGWGRFLDNVLFPKMRWVAVTQCKSGIKNNEGKDSLWSLVFRDEESELLMGEPRSFGQWKGHQFRGGQFGIVSQRGEADTIVIPEDGSVIFKGEKEWRLVGNVGEKIWKVDSDCAQSVPLDSVDL